MRTLVVTTGADGTVATGLSGDGVLVMPAVQSTREVLWAGNRPGDFPVGLRLAGGADRFELSGPHVLFRQRDGLSPALRDIVLEGSSEGVSYRVVVFERGEGWVPGTGRTRLAIPRFPSTLDPNVVLPAMGTVAPVGGDAAAAFRLSASVGVGVRLFLSGAGAIAGTIVSVWVWSARGASSVLAGRYPGDADAVPRAPYLWNTYDAADKVLTFDPPGVYWLPTAGIANVLYEWDELVEVP